jgi:hypothetical protein
VPSSELALGRRISRPVQPPGHRGNCSDLDEGKRRFKAVWAGIRTGLTDVDVETARKIEAAVDRRFKKWPVRD